MVTAGRIEENQRTDGHAGREEQMEVRSAQRQVHPFKSRMQVKMF